MIGELFGGADVFNCNAAQLDVEANEVVFYVHVFGAFVVNGILGQGDGALIVLVNEEGALERETHLTKKGG